TPFQGVLYFGLMLTADGPKVIEYNARFGDPETQVILPLLKTDLLEIMEAIEEHRLDAVSMEWEDMACACVVLCSGGYPEQYAKGLPISGLEKWPLRRSGDTVQSGQTLEMVFASGTEINNDGVTVTAGGRVLGVISRAVDLPTALEKCYEMAQDISFERLHYRRDIGS
ncbi:MAG: phosphoribosylamine--glycine ligase, partial [Clostridiaceae bacterium]|nr:phosphoribosylamine--glycine ligase [Clostridiaceae bacterium]